MKDIQELASKIRRLSLHMVHRAKASHIGSALSITDIVAVLYSRVLKIDPLQPRLESRDRFILSKGHACVAVYSALAAKGFFPESQLEDYAKDHSNMMSHISHKVAGVEFSNRFTRAWVAIWNGKGLSCEETQ